MRTKFASIVAAAAVVFSTTSLHAETIFYGPTPYLSAADSPFDLSGLGTTFWLEDFEDGELNTPGVSYAENLGQLEIRPPSSSTDSVDADDGAIDGHGSAGWSVRSSIFGCTAEFCTGMAVFRFNANQLGGYPTAAGIVWTDGFSVDKSVGISAYGPDGNSLGGIVVSDIADDSTLGTTAEDRFFGLYSSTGISELRIGASKFLGSVEADHLQYGFAVPEPGSLVISLILVTATFARRIA